VADGGAARFGVVALVLASVLWGTTGTAASLLPDTVSPLGIGASTFAVGGLLLFAFSARSSLAALRDRRSRRWIALGVVIYPLAFYSGMDAAGIAIGNVVALGSSPIFAAMLEWLGERRRLSLRWALCAGVAILGVVLLSTGRAAGEGSTIPLGVALGLLAGLAYAAYTYASTRAFAFEHAGRGVMGAMFGVGAVLLAPALVATGAPLIAHPQSLAIAAYLALVPMFLAYLLFGFGLRTIRSSVATTITLIEPVVAAALAVFVVGERLTAGGWLGLVLILAGVAALLSARLPSKPSTAA
jgi:drug/metabolite transporter, DME family